MTQHESTYQGQKKAALIKVSVTPKSGGKAVFEKIVPADSDKNAKDILKPEIDKALKKRGLTRKGVTIETSNVANIT